MIVLSQSTNKSSPRSGAWQGDLYFNQRLNPRMGHNRGQGKCSLLKRLCGCCAKTAHADIGLVRKMLPSGAAHDWTSMLAAI